MGREQVDFFRARWCTRNSCSPAAGSGWSRSRPGQQHARDAAAAWPPRAVYPPPPPDPVQPSAGSELRDAPRHGGWRGGGVPASPGRAQFDAPIPPLPLLSHAPEAPPASVHPPTSPSLHQRSQAAHCRRHPTPRRLAVPITRWCVCLPRRRVTVPRHRTRLRTTLLPQATRLFPSWRRQPRLWAPLLRQWQLLPLPPSCRLLRRPCLRTFWQLALCYCTSWLLPTIVLVPFRVRRTAAERSVFSVCGDVCAGRRYGAYSSTLSLCVQVH